MTAGTLRASSTQIRYYVVDNIMSTQLETIERSEDELNTVVKSDRHSNELTSFVTGRAFEPLVKFADEKAWDQSDLLRGLTCSEEEIRSSGSQIEWADFATYLQRFESKIGGPSGMGRLADYLTPSYGPMTNFMGLMAHPRVIYRVINRWGGPSMFPVVDHRTEELDSQTLKIELELPEGAMECPAFFRVTQLMFATAPCLVGSKPAAVEMELRRNGASYVVHLPPSGTLWARVKRAFRAFFSGAAVLDELVTSHDRLLENHRELQTTHQELERSEANLRRMVEETPEGVMVWEKDQVIYTNPAMRDFLRLSDHPERLRISKFVADREQFREFAESAEGAGDTPSEVEFVAADSEIVVGEVKAIDLEWDGQPAKLMVCRDVTERNQIMKRAMQLDRMIAVGTLAAGVAHEINNPLAFVHSNLEYAIEGLKHLEKQSDDPKVQKRVEALSEALKESVDGTHRVREIVRDLKSISRDNEEAREPVEIRDAVKSAINMGWHEIRTTAKVRTEYDDVPAVLASEGRLAQIVLNLVVNAAQSFGPDSDREHSFITVRTIRGEEFGVIQVEDNGRGIDREDLRRIFDPFFTTKPIGEGTGLGLWISQDIIARLGGTIEVESEVGRGTLFTISLPYADPADFEAPAEVPITPDHGSEPSGLDEPTSTTFRRLNKQDGRVLVIDDEPMIARLIARVLPDEVVAFSDPNQAVRHLRDDDDFDVVLCDATMPGMTGLELFGKLQAEYPDLAERFVLITGGLTSSLDTDEIPWLVTKPFDMKALRALVTEVREELQN